MAEVAQRQLPSTVGRTIKMVRQSLQVNTIFAWHAWHNDRRRANRRSAAPSTATGHQSPPDLRSSTARSVVTVTTPLSAFAYASNGPGAAGEASGSISFSPASAAATCALMMPDLRDYATLYIVPMYQLDTSALCAAWGW